MSVWGCRGCGSVVGVGVCVCVCVTVISESRKKAS